MSIWLQTQDCTLDLKEDSVRKCTDVLGVGAEPR